MTVICCGYSCRLQVFRTDGRGWGVRTLVDIPRGTYVCEWVALYLRNSTPVTGCRSNTPLIGCLVTSCHGNTCDWFPCYSFRGSRTSVIGWCDTGMQVSWLPMRRQIVVKSTLICLTSTIRSVCLSRFNIASRWLLLSSKFWQFFLHATLSSWWRWSNGDGYRVGPWCPSTFSSPSMQHG